MVEGIKRIHSQLKYGDIEFNESLFGRLCRLIRMQIGMIDGQKISDSAEYEDYG
ncbi:hypothetical protein CASFOL_031500 [Castilleja foliolosa]|uniref:Uncharacterized protein n=1 Tax=Castilleja foliolosa TaxID=1961234 RepID=A0ABD3C5J7_9LAMI